MTTSQEIVTLDPRDEGSPGPAALAARPASLDGKTLGLFSNNKPHSEELLRMIADVIAERYQIKGDRRAQQGRAPMASPSPPICRRWPGSVTWRFTPRRNEGPAPRAVCTTQWKPSCWESRPPS